LTHCRSANIGKIIIFHFTVKQRFYEISYFEQQIRQIKMSPSGEILF
jgi:hypothetical protein